MTFYAGQRPRPFVTAGAVEGEKGQVIPEINFTLPSLETGENNPCVCMRQAVAAIQELKGVRQSGGLRIPEGELRWQDRLQGEALCG
jgi:hypothetical protein